VQLVDAIVCLAAGDLLETRLKAETALVYAPVHTHTHTHTHARTHTHTHETVLKLENALVYYHLLACAGIIPAADKEGGAALYIHILYTLLYIILYIAEREREMDVVALKIQTDVGLFGGLTELTASKTKPPQMDAMVLKFQTDVCLFGGFSVPMRNAVSLSLSLSLLPPPPSR
jgi:hypothetical protein